MAPFSPEAFIRFWSIEVHPLRGAMAGMSAHPWWIGLARAVLVMVLFAMRKHMRPEIFSRAAIVFLVADLTFERPHVAETIEQKFFSQRPQTVPQLPAGARLFHQADWYGATAIARTYFDLPEMYWVIRNGAFPHTNAMVGIESALNRDIDQTALLPTADLLMTMRELRQRTPRWVEPLAAISAAGYRAVFSPIGQAGRGTSIRPIVFVPLPAVSRFYFADRIVHCTSRGDFLSLAASPAWTPRTACAGTVPFTPAGGDVLTSTETSNSATLRVRSRGDALLVFSITRHKYWRALIDGKPSTLIPANVAYQALRIPPGEHDVSLRYDNPLLRWCGVVSLIALLAVSGFEIRDSRFGRHISRIPNLESRISNRYDPAA